jgi:putative ABC transport system permease protein
MVGIEPILSESIRGISRLLGGAGKDEISGFMRFMTLVFKNVGRRPLRSLLTVCGLATAVAAVVALVGIAEGFVRSFRDVYEGHGVDLVVSRRGAADRLSSAMDEGYVRRIQQLEGVADASGFLLETLSLEEKGIYGVPTIGLHPDSRFLQDYRIPQGRNLVEKDGKAVLLGSQLVPRLEAGVGDPLVFFEGEAFQVVGVFESYSTWENGSLVIPLQQLQRLTDRPGQVTFVNVMLDGPPTQDNLERVMESIEALDERLSAMPTEDFVKTDARIRMAGAMAWMTSTIALLIGAIGMLNTMMTSVFERTREIGILRALGWKQSRVVRMILGEATLLSIGGAALGISGGTILTWWMSRLPAAAGTISPSIGAGVMGQGLAIAIVIGLVGAAYPAYRGARLLPTEALRHD